MSVRLVTTNGDRPARAGADAPAVDPRDPALFRQGLSSARAALRDGRARRFAPDPAASSTGAREGAREDRDDLRGPRDSRVSRADGEGERTDA